jgi:hypothetical protein
MSLHLLDIKGFDFCRLQLLEEFAGCVYERFVCLS